MHANSLLVFKDSTDYRSHFQLIAKVVAGEQYPKTLLISPPSPTPVTIQSSICLPSSKNNTEAYLNLTLPVPNHLSLPTRQYLLPLLSTRQFQLKCLVFCHYSRNYYLEDGLNFSMDFVVYSKKPTTELQHQHSLFCLKIDDDRLTYGDLQKLIKISHNIRKELKVVRVQQRQGTNIGEWLTKGIWDQAAKMGSLAEIVEIKEITMGFAQLK